MSGAFHQNHIKPDFFYFMPGDTDVFSPPEKAAFPRNRQNDAADFPFVGVDFKIADLSLYSAVGGIDCFFDADFRYPNHFFAPSFSFCFIISTEIMKKNNILI